MLQTWLKIFYRNSKKNWLNVVINIVGLTLGFAGLLMVMLYLNDEQSYNQTNQHADKVFRVIHQLSDGDVWSSSTDVEGTKYKEEIPEVTDVYLNDGWYGDFVVKTGSKELYVTDILRGANNFFDFFPFQITNGSSEAFKKAKNHAAISEKQAVILFGNEPAIGKTITFNGRSHIITTVYKIEGKHYFMPSIIIQYDKEPEGHWGNFSKILFVKTNKNTTSETLKTKGLAVWYKYSVLPGAKADGITPEQFIEKHGTTPVFEPLTEVRLKTITDDAGPEGKGNYQLIIIMMSLSVLLIIISCVNFINLSIASATQRAKEVGVKKTLGMSKGTLTKEYSLEIVFQGVIAFIFSLILVEFILPSFNDFMKKDIDILNMTLLSKNAIVAIVVSLLIGVIAGVYLSNFKSVEVLKGNISRSKKGILARNIMLGFQFLISGFFLTGSIIINSQVNYMIHKDLGFEGNQIVMVSMNQYDDRYKKYELAKKVLIQHPNIEAITSNSFTIGGGSSNSTNFNYKELSIQTNANAIDYNYLNVMKIKVLKGRGLNEDFASDTIKNILINETLAKNLGIYDDPIGKKLNAGFGDEDNDGKNLVIIGMVKDYNTLGLDTKIPPTAFMHWNSFDWMKQNFWKVQFKIKPNNVQETLKYIESYWKENIEQGYPFDAQFLNKRFASTYVKYQKQQTLFFILTSIVIIMSLLGLFALASLTIQQRLKEVAIRKTLGASVNEIMYQLIKSFLKVTLIASVILIPISYYFMQNWLDNFVYRIGLPIIPFIITPLILILLVFVVVGLKAYKATKINLIKYLKFE